MERASRAGGPDPLETPAPGFSVEEAARIAARSFGIEGAASTLDSERDQNFRVETGSRTTTEGNSFLLKISNAADERSVVEMQTEALLHIRRVDPELPVMEPVAAAHGSHIAEVEDPEGRTLAVRMFTFMPGEMLAAAQLDEPATEEFGTTVARVGRALRGFFHAAGGYKILWDLRHTPDLRPMLDAVEDQNRRELVNRVLDRFDREVADILPSLRSQMIHDDLTLSNVLLDDSHRVSGIVDFGDLTHTALICDLAISLVSVMWETSDPLASAGRLIRGYRTVTPIERDEARVLADLVGARLAALVLIAAWRVRRYPENAAYITANQEHAWRLLERLDAMTWDRVREELVTACLGTGASDLPTKQELLDRRQRALGPALAPLSYDDPLYLVRGEGSFLFDEAGIRYLDAYNNVPVVGHCHPHVTAAIAEQTATLNTNTRYLHHAVVELAERLAGTLPPELDTVLFYNSGSEANDIAWRLATGVTGNAGAIVSRFAYHGVSSGTISLSPEEWVAGDEPNHVATIPPPLVPEVDASQDIARALEELGSRGLQPAALYLDSMFTSDGIYLPPDGYLERLVDAVHEAGGLFVADEVQCGYGRTGESLWGFQRGNIVPDFVTFGKPMGNGYPVAAVATRREIAQRFSDRIDVFSTFGGNPVACRAALAVLDVIEEEGLQERALKVGACLRDDLTSRAGSHPVMGDVRGAGLLIGVEIVDPRTGAPAPQIARRIMNGMRERRILIGTTGAEGNVLKIRPPLVLSEREAETIVEVLGEVLETVRGSS
jgi:4-aminobutyrate aminotransferase-like enzyme/Ser/Thr protein kinase RdoA (MazF antagonist)